MKFIERSNPIWHQHNIVITISILALFITLPLTVLMVATTKRPADVRSRAQTLPITFTSCSVEGLQICYNSSTVIECVNGEWSATETCSTGEICKNGGCVPDPGTCNADQLGDTACFGNTVITCSYGYWVHTETCSGSTPICSQGTCIGGQTQCTPNDSKCEGNNYYTCNRDGFWQLEENCVFGCTDTGCADAADYCSVNGGYCTDISSCDGSNIGDCFDEYGTTGLICCVPNSPTATPTKRPAPTQIRTTPPVQNTPSPTITTTPPTGNPPSATPTSGPMCRADFNHNGDIDIDDLQTFINDAQADCSIPLPTPTPILCETNADCSPDFGICQQGFCSQGSGPTYCRSDFNRNGDIDIEDLQVLIDDAQKNCPIPSPTNSPPKLSITPMPTACSYSNLTINHAIDAGFGTDFTITDNSDGTLTFRLAPQPNCTDYHSIISGNDILIGDPGPHVNTCITRKHPHCSANSGCEWTFPSDYDITPATKTYRGNVHWAWSAFEQKWDFSFQAQCN